MSEWVIIRSANMFRLSKKIKQECQAIKKTTQEADTEPLQA
ncbi:MAG: hypothetical protein WCH01_08905 [Methylococcaceae bacterium]